MTSSTRVWTSQSDSVSTRSTLTKWFAALSPSATIPVRMTRVVVFAQGEAAKAAQDAGDRRGRR